MAVITTTDKVARWDHLLEHTRDYLRRLDGGTERAWLIDQLVYVTDESPERIGALLALLVSVGEAGVGHSEDGTTTIWPKRVGS